MEPKQQFLFKSPENSIPGSREELSTDQEMSLMNRIAKVLLLIALSGAAGSQATGLLEQCPARHLSDATEVDFSAYAGRYVYLDFWASWCGPCKASFPFMDALQGEYSPDEFLIVGLSVDEDPEDARRFAQEHPVSFLLAIDSEGSCPQTFDVLGMPTSYLIGPDGEVIFKHQGFRSSDEAKLREKIRASVVAEQP